MKTKNGFTLIELLVVISIIALLLSILMPSLGRVKEQAKTTICKTHLKQWSMGLVLYSDEYGGKMLPVLGPVGIYWFHVLAPYMDNPEYYYDPANNQLGGMRIMFCPKTKIRKYTPSQGVEWGDHETTWWFQWGHGETPAQGSYIINAWIQPGGYYGDSEKYYHNWTETNSRVPAFCDGIWVDTWPDDDDEVPRDYDGGNESGMDRIFVDRHNMAINVGFTDGHTDKVKLEDLWSLKWNKSFNTIQEI